MGNISEKLFASHWYTEVDISPDPEETTETNTTDPNTTDPNTTDPNTTDPNTTDPVAKIVTSNLKLSKIITAQNSSKEENLKLIQLSILDILYNFEEMNPDTCPVCMKGYTQLESQTCIDTAVYSFSLGLSLF